MILLEILKPLNHRANITCKQETQTTVNKLQRVFIKEACWEFESAWEHCWKEVDPVVGLMLENYNYNYKLKL